MSDINCKDQKRGLLPGSGALQYWVLCWQRCGDASWVHWARAWWTTKNPDRCTTERATVIASKLGAPCSMPRPVSSGLGTQDQHAFRQIHLLYLTHSSWPSFPVMGTLFQSLNISTCTSLAAHAQCQERNYDFKCSLVREMIWRSPWGNASSSSFYQDALQTFHFRRWHSNTLEYCLSHTYTATDRHMHAYMWYRYTLACEHTCVHTHVHTCRHTCIHVCTCVYTHMYLDTYTDVCVNTHTLYTCTCVHMCIGTPAHVHTPAAHIQTHVHMHEHIHRVRACTYTGMCVHLCAHACALIHACHT